MGYSPWGCKESDTTERLILSLSPTSSFSSLPLPLILISVDNYPKSRDSSVSGFGCT